MLHGAPQSLGVVYDVPEVTKTVFVVMG